MTLAQSLLAIVIFWAIIGGLGASLLLPAMQSLIHGNFQGPDAAEGVRARRCRSRDSRRRRSAAGRLRHDLSLLAGRVPRRGGDHRGRPLGPQARPRRPVYGRTGCRRCWRDPLGARHGRSGARDPRLGGWRRGRRSPDRRRARRPRVARLVAQAAQARGQACASGHRPLRLDVLPPRNLGPDTPADRSRRNDDRAPDLPPDGARVQRDGGGSLARAAVAEHVLRRRARGQEGR
jgi:hypothetical protein